MGGAMGESDKTPRRSVQKGTLCDLHPKIIGGRAGAGLQTRSTPSGKPVPPSFSRKSTRARTVLPALYDDGGFSGGTMERPAT